MLWFIAFKRPEWESQLCHKENNWIGNGFFSWQQSPWRLWGWEGASLFSLCPALPCYCGFMKAFPTKHWRWLLTLSLKQMWPHRTWNPGARVSPPGMLGLVPVFTCEASHGERIHVVLLTYCPYNLLQPTASQPAGKGWWQPCSSPLLCHQG